MQRQFCKLFDAYGASSLFPKCIKNDPESAGKKFSDVCRDTLTGIMGRKSDSGVNDDTVAFIALQMLLEIVESYIFN